MFQRCHSFRRVQMKMAGRDNHVIRIIPVSLQRYTAAHEYGHTSAHGRASISRRYHGMRGQVNEQEAAAQSSQRTSLPLQLVNNTLRRMGLPIDPVRLSFVRGLQALAFIWRVAATINAAGGVEENQSLWGACYASNKPLQLRSIRWRRPTEPHSDIWIVSNQTPGAN